MKKQTYDEIIANKRTQIISSGFDPLPFTAPLFDWQKLVVSWAIKQGRAALFAECGLGKTPMQLEWADQVCRHTGGSVLILAPLAVSPQTVAEGRKFGINVTHCREQSDVKPGVNITNYERLEKFTPSLFAGVVLDESSILKSFQGKTRIMLTESFAETPFRLCCTATPAPNDYTEMGQHADFLGVCSPAQMLATYFINDTFNTGDWRLKKHARTAFWEWVATWAACVSKPSDLGFSDDGYVLPALNFKTEMVHVDQVSERADGELFRNPTLSATNLHQEMRLTNEARCKRVAEIVDAVDEDFNVWCNTNYEADELMRKIPYAVEVRGDDTTEYKETCAKWFCGIELAEKDMDLIAKKCFTRTCGKKNTPKAETANTQTIQNTENAESGTVEPRRKTENICDNTTPQINTDGQSEPQSNSESITIAAGKNTKPAKSIAQRSNSNQSDTGSKIPTSRNEEDSKNTDSQSSNSTQCSNLKTDAVQSAECQTPAGRKSSLLLTTATPQTKSEDFYAKPAISELESSEMTLGDWKKRLLTSRKVVVTKGSIFGFGLNFQSCRNSVFCGLSYSYEQLHQMLRRNYRFGQLREVNAYIVQADTEGPILDAVREKMAKHDEMKTEMRIAAESLKNNTHTTKMKTDINEITGTDFNAYHGDCVRVAREMIPDESIGFTVFSPPFADLFTFSDDVADMGNCKDTDDFMVQFKYLIDELMRVTMPGRECAVHCCDLLATKWKDGDIEFKDFSGSIVTAFRERGWLLHSKVTIWKDPVIEMQRTKAHGLLYKTLRGDSANVRVGAPDYLLVFRKPGNNMTPIEHSTDDIPLDRWKELASPVWMNIDHTNVLNGREGREERDERHISPLQLDVINNALTLWSAPGDLVFSPFMGIGSEGYCALQMGRKFVGAELKESYFKQACDNLKSANAQLKLI